ncbi:unnamed protein product [Discula destructiva]
MSYSRGTLLNFLPLNPVTSNSYPKAQETRPAVDSAELKRRTSSTSSDEKSAGFRILKVAPVHYGAHGEDHQGDWHDVLSSDAREETVRHFLPLGPVTSNSYPKTQQARPAPVGAVQKRRTSSTSSDGKGTFRVLKVAPVHYGEHAGDHQEDWHDVPEVAVE